MGSACTKYYDGTSTYYMRNLTAETEEAQAAAAEPAPVTITTVTASASAIQATPAANVVKDINGNDVTIVGLTVGGGGGGGQPITASTTTFCSTGTLLVGPTGLYMRGVKVDEDVHGFDMVKRWMQSMQCKSDVRVHEIVRRVTHVVVPASVAPAAEVVERGVEGGTSSVGKQEKRDGLEPAVMPPKHISPTDEDKVTDWSIALGLGPPALMA